MTKKFVLLFFTLRYLKPVQIYWRIYLKLIQLLPFSLAIHPAVKIRRLNLLPAIANYSAMSSRLTKSLMILLSIFKQNFFYQRSARYEC